LSLFAVLEDLWGLWCKDLVLQRKLFTLLSYLFILCWFWKVNDDDRLRFSVIIFPQQHTIWIKNKEENMKKERVKKVEELTFIFRVLSFFCYGLAK